MSRGQHLVQVVPVVQVRYRASLVAFAQLANPVAPGSRLGKCFFHEKKNLLCYRLGSPETKESVGKLWRLFSLRVALSAVLISGRALASSGLTVSVPASKLPEPTYLRSTPLLP